MAEKSIFWTTGTEGDGANPYTEAEVVAWLRRTFGSGVLYGYGNGLVVSGTSSPVSIATGAASVDGFPYESDAVVRIDIPTPAANTRVDRIVVRANWSARTCRITRIAGTEGAGPPSLTQNRGSIWDMPLASVSITTGGVITVTDEREFAHFTTQVVTENLANGAVTDAKLATAAVTNDKIAGGAVTEAKLADGAVKEAKLATAAVTLDKIATYAVSGSKIAPNAVATNKIANEAVTEAKIANRAVTNDKLANGAVTRDKIANNAVTDAKLATAAVTNDKIANNVITDDKLRDSVSLSVIGRSANSSGDPADIVAGADGAVLRRAGATLGFGQVATAGIADDAVDDTKVGNRVPQVYRRQGGSSSNWSTPGTNNYTPGAVRIQVGSKRCDSSGSVNVTFPVAFSAPPIVFVESARTSQQTVSVSQSTISTTGFTARVVDHYASDIEPHAFGDARDIVFWLAIGAE
jgi:hypothetical protein